jgi:hypothetical protein
MNPLAQEEPPEPIEVSCPKCGDPHFADMDPYENWPDLEAQGADSPPQRSQAPPNEPDETLSSDERLGGC